MNHKKIKAILEVINRYEYECSDGNKPFITEETFKYKNFVLRQEHSKEFKDIKTFFKIKKYKLGTSYIYNTKLKGNSGSLIFFSNDYKYIIKTIRRSEKECLDSFINSYKQYLLCNPDSLLVKILDCFTISKTKCQCLCLENNEDGFGFCTETIIIMLNVLDSINIENIYDLKGEGINRSSNGYILKEDEWTEDGVKLKGVYKEFLIDQISKDCMFLLTNNIMDYSLIVATYQESLDSNFKMYPVGICKINLHPEFSIGIVDILTKYNKIKKLEYYMNLFCCMKKSCVDPQKYFTRFLEFVKNEMFED